MQCLETFPRQRMVLMEELEQEEMFAIAVDADGNIEVMKAV